MLEGTLFGESVRLYRLPKPVTTDMCLVEFVDKLQRKMGVEIDGVVVGQAVTIFAVIGTPSLHIPLAIFINDTEVLYDSAWPEVYKALPKDSDGRAKPAPRVPELLNN